MIPIDQTIVAADRKDGVPGNCLQAAVASMLELPLEAVPHFLLSGDKWFEVFHCFFWAHGYSWEGNQQGKPTELINGCAEVSVPSRTFEGNSHSVLIDADGVVIHDPNPNKAWLGVNVVETGEMHYWTVFKPREDQKQLTPEEAAC